MKLKSKIEMVLHRRKKLSCIKTELKRCIMTESLLNKYDLSRKSPDVGLILLPKSRDRPKCMRLIGSRGRKRCPKNYPIENKMQPWRTSIDSEITIR